MFSRQLLEQTAFAYALRCSNFILSILQLHKFLKPFIYGNRRHTFFAFSDKNLDLTYITSAGTYIGRSSFATSLCHNFVHCTRLSTAASNTESLDSPLCFSGRVAFQLYSSLVRGSLHLLNTTLPHQLRQEFIKRSIQLPHTFPALWFLTTIHSCVGLSESLVSDGIALLTLAQYMGMQTAFPAILVLWSHNSVYIASCVGVQFIGLRLLILSLGHLHVFPKPTLPCTHSNELHEYTQPTHTRQSCYHH